MRKRTNKNSKSVALGILLGIVLVAGLVFGGLVLFGPKDEGVAPDGNSSELTDDQYVSKDEQDDMDNGGEVDDSIVDAGDNKKSLNVSVDADYINGAIEAYSTVYGTVDTSGKCTYTFVAPDGSSVDVVTEALSGPSTVTCARAEFRTAVNGSWQVMLKYETSNAIGEGSASVVVQ